MVILIAIIIACLLYLGRGVIVGSLVNHDPVDPAPSSSMNNDNAGR